MADPTFLIALAITLVSIALFVLTILIRRQSGAKNEEEDAQRPRGVPVGRGGAEDAPRRAGRNVRARMRAAATRPDDEDEDDPLADEIAMPDGKIGVKKRKKLELKAEKRVQREREVEEREERKQRLQELEDRRKKEDEKEKEEQLRQEAEEKALKEEKEKQEQEEYLKLKEAFAIEEEGFDEEETDENPHKFQEFLNYIKEQKVVLMEDLASRFKLKTQDTIDRVQELLAQEWLAGVIDDRGKFIYITKEEFEAVAQFIRQRGRVSIAELVEHSNTLINLQTDTAEPVIVAS